MKFFEINDPYYALIKAENLEVATQEYIEVVAGDEEEESEIKKAMKVVDPNYALIKLSRSAGENGKLLEINEVIQDFNIENNSVLLIDGSLL